MPLLERAFVQIAALRNCLRTFPDDRKWIATVPRVGCRFLAEARLGTEGQTRRFARPLAAAIPAIAVLPFANMSNDPEHHRPVQGSRATGHREELGLRLQGAKRRPQTLAQEVGVRYIVDGSVRRAASRVRISAQLIDRFAVKDEVVGKIVNALSMTHPSAKPLAKRRITKLEAHDLFVRARPLVTRSPEGNRTAQTLLAWSPAWRIPPRAAFLLNRNHLGNRSAPPPS